MRDLLHVKGRYESKTAGCFQPIAACQLSRYSDSQIQVFLKQTEADTPVPELCRENGMSSTHSGWDFVTLICNKKHSLI